MAAAKAFWGGFLDGFTMAGIWKPRLTIPGAATRLFRPEPTLEEMAEGIEAARKASEAQRKNPEAPWVGGIQFSPASHAEPEPEIEMELSVLYAAAIKRGKELGLDEEQMENLHASVLERLRNAGKHQPY